VWLKPGFVLLHLAKSQGPSPSPPLSCGFPVELEFLPQSSSYLALDRLRTLLSLLALGQMVTLDTATLVRAPSCGENGTHSTTTTTPCEVSGPVLSIPSTF
jgi:hypothetical protein